MAAKRSIYILVTVLAVSLFVVPAFSQTTRYPNGVTNVSKSDPLGMLPILDPTRMIIYYEDFLDAAASPENINFATGGADTYKNWVVTKAGTPVVNVYGAAYGTATGRITSATWGTASGIGASGGILSVSNTYTDNDFYSMQHVLPSFYLDSGKSLWFEAKINFVTSVTQADILVGLCGVDTTPITSLSDGIYFQSDDGDAYLDFEKCHDASVRAATAVLSLATGTWYTMTFHYDGVDEVKYYVNGTHYGTQDTTNLPTDTELTPTFHLQNGEDSDTNCLIDYIFVARER